MFNEDSIEFWTKRRFPKCGYLLNKTLLLPWFVRVEQMVGITSASTKMFLFIPFTLNFTISISCIFEFVVSKTLILIFSFRIGRRFSLSFNDLVMYVRCAPLSKRILHFSRFLLSKLMTSVLAVTVLAGLITVWSFWFGNVGCTFVELFPVPELFPPVDFKLLF